MAINQILARLAKVAREQPLEYSQEGKADHLCADPALSALDMAIASVT